MRICLFTSSLKRGGAERVFVNLANFWVRSGIDVDFVVLTAEGGLKDELSKSVRLIDLSNKKCRIPLRIHFIRRFSNYLKHERPDKVFSTLTYVNITALWAKRISNYKGRMAVRQANSLYNQSEKGLAARIWNWIGYKVCFQWADAIIVNSKNSKIEVISINPALSPQIRLIYNPVEVLPKKKTCNSSSNLPLILASGRLSKQKDYPTLLRAFRRIRDAREARLIILGEGAERLAIEQLIKKMNLSPDVCLLGSVSNPFEYYYKSDLFILTSKWEGFPNVLTEALSAGVPVLATDCLGASREIIEPILPKNILPVGDDRALAARALETLEESIDPGALTRYAESRFKMDIIAAAYLEA